MSKINYNNIKVVLVSQGRSQTWLATQLGTTKNAVNAMCSNTSQPSLKRLFEIAKILNCTVCQLIGDGKEIKSSKDLNNLKEY